MLARPQNFGSTQRGIRDLKVYRGQGGTKGLFVPRYTAASGTGVGDAEEDIHYLIKELLAYPPQTMHLVLATRRDPPLSFSRLRAHDQMTEIRAADLRFTTDETKALLNKMMRVPIDDETVGLLEKKTEGWVAGLRLAGLYLRDQKDPKHKVQELSSISRSTWPKRSYRDKIRQWRPVL